MKHDDKSGSEDEPLFPSGRWYGFEVCKAHGRIFNHFDLKFSNGRIAGSYRCGPPNVAKVVGTYDAELLECRFRIFVVGGDDGYYRGFREGRGIWGTFRYPVKLCMGGFKIWPFREGEGVATHVSESADGKEEAADHAVRRPALARLGTAPAPRDTDVENALIARIDVEVDVVAEFLLHGGRDRGQFVHHLIEVAVVRSGCQYCRYLCRYAEVR